MARDLIVNLVGASGTGKTSVAKELSKLGYNVIQSYTNRKPRYKNEWGHEFIDEFINKDKTHITFKHKGNKLNQRFIAYFNNYDKHQHYFATTNQYKGKGTSIYIVDPIGAEQVKSIVKDAKVITIHLDADENTRRLRLTQDRKKQEVDDRLKKDKVIFNNIPSDFIVDAGQIIQKVTKEIVTIIENRRLGGD